jgi:hypothetical protein
LRWACLQACELPRGRRGKQADDPENRYKVKRIRPREEDLGISRIQAYRWQMLASLDDDIFETRVADAKRQAVKSVEMTAAQRADFPSLECWSATLQNSQLPIGRVALAVWGFLSLGGANAGT